MRIGRYLAGLALAGLAACASEGGDGQATVPTGDNVVAQDGEGTGLRTFSVLRQGRRMQVRVYNRGEGLSTVAVTSRTVRGLDRSDARMAYDAAFEAAQKFDCNGAPLNVLGQTATFQEEGRRSAFTNGEAAWIFQARCG